MPQSRFIYTIGARLEEAGLSVKVPSGCVRQTRTFSYGKDEFAIEYTGIRDFLILDHSGRPKVFAEVIGIPEMGSVPLSELQDFLSSEHVTARAKEKPWLKTVLIARTKLPPYADEKFRGRVGLFCDLTETSVDDLVNQLIRLAAE